MAELSPAAEAVFDAFMDASVDAGNYYATRKRQIAAALRAAADQVVPKTPPLKFPTHTHYEEGIWDGKDDTRDHLLAIADELDGASNTRENV